jgi:hypothetical protein
MSGQVPSSSAPEREPIYRVIRGLMLFDLVLGLALLFLAGPLWHMPSLQVAGAILAVIGGGLYWLFGWLAARSRARGRG